MIKRIAAFAGLPLLSSLASFILLPIIANVGGTSAWNSLAVGQAVGAIAAILVGLGWPLTGPAAVASAAEESVRRRYYAVSFVTRSVVLICAVPLMAVALMFTNGTSEYWVAFLMACAQAAAGLTPAWYCIATGHAGRIAKYDVVPRMLATLGVIPLLFATGDIYLYPLALIVLGLAGTLWFNKDHSRRQDYQGLGARNVLKEIWGLRAGAGITAAAGAYASTPVLVVQFAASATGLAGFVSAEKFYRIGQLATAALGNSLQGWVSEHGTDHRHRRKFSLMALTGLGLAGWLILSLLGPFVSERLFGAERAADFWTCFWFGLSFLLVCVTTSTGAHWLVPAKRMKAVFASTITGAVVGLPAMAILSSLMGVQGGALGLAIGEVAVTLIQLRAIVQLLGDKAPEDRNEEVPS